MDMSNTVQVYVLRDLLNADYQLYKSDELQTVPKAAVDTYPSLFRAKVVEEVGGLVERPAPARKPRKPRREE